MSKKTSKIIEYNLSHPEWHKATKYPFIEETGRGMQGIIEHKAMETMPMKLKNTQLTWKLATQKEVNQGKWNSV